MFGRRRRIITEEQSIPFIFRIIEWLKDAGTDLFNIKALLQIETEKLGISPERFRDFLVLHARSVIAKAYSLLLYLLETYGDEEDKEKAKELLEEIEKIDSVTYAQNVYMAINGLVAQMIKKADIFPVSKGQMRKEIAKKLGIPEKYLV